jgi:aminopeptidase-like protein
MQPVTTAGRTTTSRSVGQEAYRLIKELMPYPRSLTGHGVRQTLATVRDRVPLELVEIPSGTPVFDWTVPREWNVREAWIAGPDGRRIVDFNSSHLHLVGYSIPIRARISLTELRPHLHSLPDRPDLVPYRTSYYAEAWGFCITDRELQQLPDGEYEVCIDSSLVAGALTYGELLVPGATEEEVLVSTHVCHPAMVNDNLSGIALATLLAEHTLSRKLRYSYRFLFVPGTIGSITWLALNQARTNRIVHGLVLTGLGDNGAPTYKRSRRGNALIDRAAEHVLRASGRPVNVFDFYPYGYDERQYCSPGFNLPVGRLGRSPHGEYPEYHTSGDDLSFVHPEALEDSWCLLLGIIDVLERDAVYRSRNPFCEPQLGRRGLYRSAGAATDRAAAEMALLWVLNLADGQHSLLDIAERSALGFPAVADAADSLMAAELLDRECTREKKPAAGDSKGPAC